MNIEMIHDQLASHGITEYDFDDIQECVRDLAVIFPGQFFKFPSDIQCVLTEIRFLVGHDKFIMLKKFIRAVRGNDLPGMILEMKDSRWYGQVPNRAEDLIRMVKVFVR